MSSSDRRLRATWTKTAAPTWCAAKLRYGRWSALNEASEPRGRCCFGPRGPQPPIRAAYRWTKLNSLCFQVQEILLTLLYLWMKVARMQGARLNGYLQLAGMFIAKISRGRTIKQFINGTLTAPVIYAFMWLVIFGGVGIRQERTSTAHGRWIFQLFHGHS